MDDSLFLLLPDLALLGAIALLLPHLVPRRYFFGITVAPAFPATETARAALHRYHRRVGYAIGVTALGIVLLAPRLTPTAGALLPLLPFLAAIPAFLAERARIRSAAGSVDASALPHPAADHHPPRWLSWAVAPFALPLATAIYLRAHWTEIPERFPIHWGADGQPNGWANRTPGGVYGPLLFAAGLMLLILLLGLAIYYGSRHSPQMLSVLKVLIGVTYFLALVFSGVGLIPLQIVSPMLFVATAPVFIVALLVYTIHSTRKLSAHAESTPDACWTLGSVYYNPGDPALFVQKRIGLGYTFNFAHRLSWVILGGFFAGLAGLVAFLLVALKS